LDKLKNKINQTWQLIKISLIVLMRKKKLLLFPLFSLIGLFAVTTTYTAISYFTGALFNENGQISIPYTPYGNATLMDYIIYFGYIFSFYFINYLLIVYFNAALISCAKLYLNGKDPSIKDGFIQANSRIKSILGWALIAAFVSLFFKIIESNSKTFGKVISSILGVAWSMVTFLVIPIIVVEGKGPIESFKESKALLKKSWGDQILLNVGFGIIFLPLIVITPFVLYALFFSTDDIYHPIIFIFYISFWVLASILYSVIQTMFQTALYIYLKEGIEPNGFPPDLLNNSVISE